MILHLTENSMLTKSAFAAVLACSLPLGLAACATIPADEVTRAAMVQTVSGTLSYRERIALPPGATKEIVVSDITLGDNRETILSRSMQPIRVGAPPVPFSIDVSQLNMTDGPLYGLRAFIREPDGSIMFRTSSPVLLNMRGDRVDVGDVQLFMTSSDDRGMTAIPGMRDGTWRVTQIGNDVVPPDSAPKMTFGVDGRFYGTTGCNNFISSYELSGSSLDLAAIGASRRACEPGLMEQERRFLNAISVVENASLAQEGFLILEGSGQRLVATRD